MMAIAQRWICFECAQSSDSSKACFECTYCQVRFCFACQKRHPSNHSRYLVTLQNATGNGSSPQRCVDCEEMVGLRYSCEGCSYAKCLECWRRSGINRHEHQNFSLYELRENYERAKRPLQARHQSSPANVGARFAPSAGLPLRPVQSQGAGPGTQFNPPQTPQGKRHSITRGLKKAYALSQKNTLTKVATGLAIGTISVAIGSDLSGIVDGFDALDVGADSAGGDMDAGIGDQGDTFADTSSNGGQDFSNLQNGSAETTEWMQQQYWQNVTLPQVAGPSITPAMLSPVS